MDRDCNSSATPRVDYKVDKEFRGAVCKRCPSTVAEALATRGGAKSTFAWRTRSLAI